MFNSKDIKKYIELTTDREVKVEMTVLANGESILSSTEVVVLSWDSDAKCTICLNTKKYHCEEDILSATIVNDEITQYNFEIESYCEEMKEKYGKAKNLPKNNYFPYEELEMEKNAVLNLKEALQNYEEITINNQKYRLVPIDN